MNAQTARPHAPSGRRGRRPVVWVAWSLVATYIASFALATWFERHLYAALAPQADQLAVATEVVLAAVVGGTFGLVGALIVSRRPRQVIGWLLLATAGAFAIERLASRYPLVLSSDPSVAPPFHALLATWISSWAVPLIVVLGLVLVPLLYPDGRLPSSRWRPVPWAAGVLVATLALAEATDEHVSGSFHPVGEERVAVFSVPNPVGGTDRWGLPAWELVVLSFVALLLLAAASVVIRFRRSQGVERLQMRWLVFAVVLLMIAMMAAFVGGALFELPRFPSALEQVPVLLLAAYPAAVGIAILRYRLYAIDRLVSRTVSYGLVIAVLGGVYAAGVVGLSTAASTVTGQDGSDLVVAGSVLAVVALFRPVRSQVQKVVDRRFNRSGYEAGLAVDAFAHQLRGEVDLEQLRHEVVTTATAAVLPTTTSVWLADQVGTHQPRDERRS